MVVVMQKTKKRMGFTFKIQEAEVIRAALEFAADQRRDGPDGFTMDPIFKRLAKNLTRRLAREQEWIAAGGKVSHAP